MAYKKSRNTANSIKNDIKKFLKEDDELKRKLDEIPKAHSQTRADKIGKQQAKGSGYELIPSQEQELDISTQIVDVVKPIGFWTSMILGQKLAYLIQSAQTINDRGNKGFWASMIEAQDRAAGRQKGRSR